VGVANLLDHSCAESLDSWRLVATAEFTRNTPILIARLAPTWPPSGKANGCNKYE
jgi:hypothetical protein